MSELAAKEVVVSLGALAQELRLRIYRALVEAVPHGLTPGVLAERLDVPPSTLSFHLRELSHSGLITQHRESRFLFYRADFERMNALVDYLTAHCCDGRHCGFGPERSAPKKAQGGRDMRPSARHLVTRTTKE